MNLTLKQLTFFLHVAALCICMQGAAQPASRKTSAEYSRDTALISSLLKQYHKTWYPDTAKALPLLTQAEALAQKWKDKRWIGKVEWWKCSTTLPTIREQIPCLVRLLDFYKGTDYTRDIANAHRSLGSAYGRLKHEGDKSYAAKELEEYLMAKKLIEKNMEDKRLYSGILSNIGGAYMFIQDPKALDYWKLSLDILQREVKDSSILTLDMQNLGGAYSHFKNYPKAIEYLTLALKFDEKGEDWAKRFVASGHSTLSRTYFNVYREKGYEELGISASECINKALEHNERALQVAKELNLRDMVALSAVNYADYYCAKGDFGKALKYLQDYKQLLDSFYLNDEAGLAETLRDVYAGLGKMDSAYKYARLYANAKDTLHKYDVSTDLTRKEVEYEFSKTKDSLRHVEEITSETLKQQQLLSYQRLQELRLKEASLNLSEKEREIDHLAFLQTEAELKSAQLVRDEKEKQLTIAQQEKDLQASKLKLQQAQLSLQSQELASRKRQQMFLVIALALIAALFFFIFRNHKNKQQAKAQLDAERQKAQKAEAVRKMAEFEMHGLRAQLNPHFMFNSLNAIQEQILKLQNESASNYLTNFARMVRQLLENAEHPFISLEKELEFIKLYLSMEKLRMPEMEYTIDMDDDIDLLNTRVPNMILQPYLENAIWHGLSQKQGSKHITLIVRQQSKAVLIAIEDNGIGRRKANELKNKYRKAHNSKAMELLRKRFELLHVEFGSEVDVRIFDMEQAGTAIGTRVELYIPLAFSESTTGLLSETIHNN